MGNHLSFNGWGSAAWCQCDWLQASPSKSQHLEASLFSMGEQCSMVSMRPAVRFPIKNATLGTVIVFNGRAVQYGVNATGCTLPHQKRNTWNRHCFQWESSAVWCQCDRLYASPSK